MYQAESAAEALKRRGRLSRAVRAGQVSRNVLLLGATSMVTDISSEMIAAILPLYLVFELRLSPAQFGVVDGIYQGVTALVRLGGGYLADRWRRYKEVATFGYAVSAATKLGFLAVGNAVAGLAAVVAVDRAGKGIRTAPRDALISLSSAPAVMATSFGVHRALDTAGAMLGPLVAFGLLALAPRAFDAVFVVSFCIALIGIGIISLFVENRAPSKEEDGQVAAPSPRAALALLGGRRFRALLLMSSGFALFTMSDGLLYLGLQEQLDFDERFLPLLYMGTAASYMLLAVPMGRLADRVGRVRVFVGGYVLLLLAYASLLAPPLGLSALIGYLALVGAYYAATEGVLAAVVSAVLPETLRGSGLALVVTATSLARLLASVAFGALWSVFGIDTAVACFAGGLLLVMTLSVLFLRFPREQDARLTGGAANGS